MCAVHHANPRLQTPLGHLERILIDDFVRARGYDPQDLSELTPQDRDKLLKEAALYASARLSEVEARSHFVHEIGDAGLPAKAGQASV